MTGRTSLQRWASPTTPSRQAVELVRKRSVVRSLDIDLRNIVEGIQKAQFLIVNLQEADFPTLGRAVNCCHAALGKVRLCLAGDRHLLSKVEASTLEGDHVGLMLDNVDFDTAWADLLWDRLEGVRFRPAFVTKAAREMRAALALESMLALSREVGLRTLGSGEGVIGASVCEHFEFDYHRALGSSDGAPLFSQAATRHAEIGIAVPVER